MKTDDSFKRELRLPLDADPSRYPKTPTGAAVRRAYASFAGFA